MTKETLWPEFLFDVSERNPKTVLNEQAKFLADGTKNILTATVKTSMNNSNGSFIYNFSIVAPSLSNYT